MENILVVDDEEYLVDLLCEFLELKGFKATGFYSSLDALESIKKNKYDLIITDYQMPEMNGSILSDEICKIHKDQKIFMLTAHHDIESIEKNKNITSVFSKPMKYNELIKKINDI